MITGQNIGSFEHKCGIIDQEEKVIEEIIKLSKMTRISALARAINNISLLELAEVINRSSDTVINVFLEQAEITNRLP
jgi:hypothetical protein